jgi:hypothetical protein
MLIMSPPSSVLQVQVTATSGVSGPAGIIASGDQAGLIGTSKAP